MIRKLFILTVVFVGTLYLRNALRYICKEAFTKSNTLLQSPNMQSIHIITEIPAVNLNDTKEVIVTQKPTKKPIPKKKHYKKPANKKSKSDNNDFQLALCITTDSSTLTNEIKNTISELSMFQRNFNFKGAVFTDSKPIIEYASSNNIVTFPIVKRNKFKMPLFKEIMLTLQHSYNATFYGYMNSDILMHPYVFDLLDETQEMQRRGVLHRYVELGARVRVVDSTFVPNDFSSIDTCIHTFNQTRPGYWRSHLTADIFLFTKLFPFKKIPRVVVGRAYVDSAILQTTRYVGGNLVDFSDYVINMHQGRDTFRNHDFEKQSEEDKEYNKRFLKKEVTTLEKAKYTANREEGIVVK